MFNKYYTLWSRPLFPLSVMLAHVLALSRIGPESFLKCGTSRRDSRQANSRPANSRCVSNGAAGMTQTINIRFIGRLAVSATGCSTE